MPRQSRGVSPGHKTVACNNNNDYEIIKRPKESGPELAARKRWRILAEALFRGSRVREGSADVSVRRFTSFGVFAPARRAGGAGGDCSEYATSDGRFSLSIRHLDGNFSAADLMGFNNTGNICVWPSEETLSLFITSNLQLFHEKSVLELGGGMSCMAGLLVAKYGNASDVFVTDGNVRSVDNVRTIIQRNALERRARCSVLKWEDRPHPPADGKYDALLVADCLFFDEVRQDLVDAMWFYLSDAGTAYVMAPRRGATLRLFVAAARGRGFACEKREKYHSAVWERHLQLLESDPTYDPGLHYPILLKLNKVNFSPRLP